MAMYKLNEAYQDKFSFYIYYQDKLKTLDEWIRETDLSESFYFGGTLDYHFKKRSSALWEPIPILQVPSALPLV